MGTVFFPDYVVFPLDMSVLKTVSFSTIRTSFPSSTTGKVWKLPSTMIVPTSSILVSGRAVTEFGVIASATVTAVIFRILSFEVLHGG